MKYRNKLPQQNGAFLLTDGGLETVMVFQEGIDLPEFSSVTLLTREDAPDILRNYFAPYATIAQHHQLGLVLATPTWRASTDWGGKLGFSTGTLDALNRGAVAEMERVRSLFETESSPMPVAGCIGPRGDGYSPSRLMTVKEAARYHDRQVALFADTAADFISALTINYAEEAIGIIHAARTHNIPVEMAFTVETDGHLPTGDRLTDVIRRCDEETDGFPLGYMINCAHPSHFAHLLDSDEDAWKRLTGIRANASRRSHAELDAATELDDGDPAQLGREMADLAGKLESICVFGGCCGTDHRHIEQIAAAVAPIGKRS